MSKSFSIKNIHLIQVLIVTTLFFSSCQTDKARNNESTELATTSASLSSDAPAPISLENVWVKLGDSKGEIDKENDIASVESAEFSPDGKYIISGSKKGWEAIMWEVETGNKVWENKLFAEIEAVAFSCDGRFVAIGGEDKSIRIYISADGTEVQLLNLKAPVDGLRFSNNGNFLVGGDEAGIIHKWQTSDWKEIKTAIQGEDEAAGGAQGKHADINSIDFTKDDKYMSSAGRNSVIKLWNVADMSLIRTFEGHTGSVKSARISPDGKLVASASAAPDSTGDNTVRVWDFETGKQLVEFDHQLGMEAVEFTPDGKFLLAGGREGGGYDAVNITNGFIYVYQIPADPIKDKIKEVYKKPVFRSEYLHFSNDGKLLVSSHEDGTLRLWKVLIK